MIIQRTAWVSLLRDGYFLHKYLKYIFGDGFSLSTGIHPRKNNKYHVNWNKELIVFLVTENMNQLN